MPNEYTHIEEAEVWTCNDCGAYAETKEKVKHYPTCKPGESKKEEQCN
jgi:rubrerythrin